MVLAGLSPQSTMVLVAWVTLGLRAVPNVWTADIRCTQWHMLPLPTRLIIPVTLQKR